MAVTPKVFAQSATLTAADATYGGLTLARRIIDKCTVYNSDTTARTVTINLVVAAGTAGVTIVVMVKTLQAGETYTCPEVVGHILEANDFLSAKASTTTVVNLRLCGREVS